MRLKIPLSYMCSRKLGSEGDLSVCCFEIFGSSNHDPFEIGDLYRVKNGRWGYAEAEDIPKKSIMVGDIDFRWLLQGGCFPRMGVQGKFPI